MQDGAHSSLSRKMRPWSSISTWRLLHRSIRFEPAPYPIQAELGPTLFMLALFRSFVPFQGGCPKTEQRGGRIVSRKTTGFRLAGTQSRSVLCWKNRGCKRPNTPRVSPGPARRPTKRNFSRPAARAAPPFCPLKAKGEGIVDQVVGGGPACEHRHGRAWSKRNGHGNQAHQGPCTDRS